MNYRDLCNDENDERNINRIHDPSISEFLGQAIFYYAKLAQCFTSRAHNQRRTNERSLVESWVLDAV